jgi:hypothetical protein
MSVLDLRAPREAFSTVACRYLPTAIAVIGLLCSGCTTLIPRKSGASPLPNGITEYRDPSFESRISWVGWAFIGATTAGGAYQGYRSNLALRWGGWEQKPALNPIGNAALGAMAGLASSLLTTWIFGRSAPPVTSDNAEYWLDCLDDRMMVTQLDTLHPGIPIHTLLAVPRSMGESRSGIAK